jgi:hypothetical protein
MAVPLNLQDAVAAFNRAATDRDWNDFVNLVRETINVRSRRRIAVAKAAISVGDSVQFKDRLGYTRVITVTKICPKNIKGVENMDGKTTRWTVGATLVKPVA